MNNGSSVQRQLRTREGVVVSRGLDKARMDKTVVVQVTRLTRHPIYERVLRRSTKYHAHDERNECRPGDRVRIVECRPLSKTKCWRVIEIVSRAQ
ncbi:MAG: 30S ribosomal protein S17 [candidate division WS1 bacterium]|jgi:small subunit ribosomal protein S17|nr:30S ribosomal protein S17 [candidate division WS1 bacterium]